MHILLSGGTGFIGSYLISALHARGDAVTCLYRNDQSLNNLKRYQHGPESIANARLLDNIEDITNDDSIDVIIDLAGAPINKRWTTAYKKVLVDSRVKSSEKMIALIKRLKNKPQVLINASAIGYYGSGINSAIDERSAPEPSFTHDLCRLREQTADQAKAYGVRVCQARFGVVLGPDGGALAQMLPAFKIGMGGRLGHGQQYFSWVHINDAINAILCFIENETLDSAFNITAPHAITNAVFSTTLAQQLNRPCFMHLPAWFIKAIFGEMGDILLLNGHAVQPTRLIEAGFQFNYPELSPALQQILHS